MYYSYLRKNNRLESLEQQQENRAFESQVITVEEKMLNKTDAIRIHRILHEMQEPYKEVFSLRIFGELSFKQIGSIFGKTENWACVTYHRAIYKIQQEMEE